jgi:hypothetical protein
MPTYSVSRIGSVENGSASECSLCVIPDGMSAATASRNANGYVTLTVWTLLPDGSMQQYSQTAADPQAGIHITGIGPGEFATAGMSTAGGHVKSIFWRAGASTGDGQAGQGNAVSVTSFPLRFALVVPPPTPPPPPGTQVVYSEGYLVATAHATSTHHLRVTAWFAGVKIVSGISTLAGASGGEATATSIATKQTYLTGTNMSSADVVVGSISSGKLHLGTWRLYVASKTALPSVGRLHAEGTGESVKEIATATYPPDPATRMVTALITDQGNLKVILWQLNADGTLTRRADTTAGTASEISCAFVSDSIAVTAFRSSTGLLKLIYWQLPVAPSDPQTIARVAEIEGGHLPSYGGVSVGHWRASHSPVGDLGETLVAVRTEGGNLKVIRFHLTAM